MSKSTVRCSLRPWRLPWTAWTPWTLYLCQDASECGVTAMSEQLTRAALERRKEKVEDRCCCCHPPHHAHLPQLSGPFRAAQVRQYRVEMEVQSECIYIFYLPFNTRGSRHFIPIDTSRKVPGYIPLNFRYYNKKKMIPLDETSDMWECMCDVQQHSFSVRPL